ncbi:MAG: A/G-specific adenine glycosylase [Rhodocyclaceae bacterium]|nr:A/G-specific adenine glycosylase [Rhodocyclaceae bacterium]
MSDFGRRLIRWQKLHGRHGLPWQESTDPYRVWLSEIMLQQTQVATVIPYYLRFLAVFPTLADLAAAPVEQVMGLWSGLGYYARARNLHACAQAVVAGHGGHFPRQPEQLAALPGIGRSTANAIAVFCFAARAPILDGNVKRVLCRCFGIEGHPGESAVEKQLWAKAASLLPDIGLPTYIQAQMDLGALVCLRGKPLCGTCPLADICVAHREGRVKELPEARPRKSLPEKTATFLFLRHGDTLLLERRPPAGLWGGLLAPPQLEPGDDPAAHLKTLGYKLLRQQALEPLRHSFSHFHLTLEPLLCDVSPLPRAAQSDLVDLAAADVEAAPLPAPIRRLIGKIEF